MNITIYFDFITSINLKFSLFRLFEYMGFSENSEPRTETKTAPKDSCFQYILMIFY